MGTKKRPSIRDVARESGVSPTTVSLILNKADRRISHSTRSRVLDAIDRLNYKPSRLARELTAPSARTLAVVLPALDKAFSDPYFGEILSGIYDHATAYDFRIMLEVAGRNFVRRRRYMQILEDRSVAALLFIGATEEHRWLEEFSATALPLLLVNNHFRQWDLNTVLCDYPTAGRMAADYLVRLGHHEIGHLCGAESEVLTAQELTTSFTDRLREFGVHLPDRFIIDGQFTVDGGARAAEQLLNLHPGITAIFCGNDKMAYGAYQAAKARNLRIGRDISIVGCDDLPASAFADPPLTTFRLNYYDLGVAACSRMLDLLNRRQRGGSSAQTRSTIVDDADDFDADIDPDADADDRDDHLMPGDEVGMDDGDPGDRDADPAPARAAARSPRPVVGGRESRAASPADLEVITTSGNGSRRDGARSVVNGGGHTHGHGDGHGQGQGLNHGNGHGHGSRHPNGLPHESPAGPRHRALGPGEGNGRGSLAPGSAGGVRSATSPNVVAVSPLPPHFEPIPRIPVRLIERHSAGPAPGTDAVL